MIVFYIIYILVVNYIDSSATFVANKPHIECYNCDKLLRVEDLLIMNNENIVSANVFLRSSSNVI